MRRSFLFLQGPCTPFFARLAKRLISDGHSVHRINFCGGDVLYWGLRASSAYTEPIKFLEIFLEEKYRQYGITDQILFGDRRPVHRPAIAFGQWSGVRSHVFEEGYFRPYWITLEREGVNAHSRLPRDPVWFREAGKNLQDIVPVTEFISPFRHRALHDVLYHAAGLTNSLVFSSYKNHSSVSAPIEYLGYLRRFIKLKLIGERDRQRALHIANLVRPYYVLLLQLNTDAQIRHHSPFKHMGDVIRHVLESFARYAPADSKIVIKNHPLDPGLMNHEQIVDDCEQLYGLQGRVEYLEDGDTDSLIANSTGVVTVNSTAGMIALAWGVPTITLSDPIYNISGLTYQNGLEEFWRDRVPPDPELFRFFRRCVMAATQINGGFYCKDGISLAVDNSAKIVAANHSPMETLL